MDCVFTKVIDYNDNIIDFVVDFRVKQHYPAQKNNQKKHVVLKQGHNSGLP